MILLAAAISTLMLAHILRAVRQSTLFAYDVRPRTFHLALGLSFAYVVDAVVPLRIGELVRAIYISARAGQRLGLVLATIVFERLTDLWAVVLILPLLSYLVRSAPATLPLALMVMVGASSGIVAAALLVRISRATRRAVWAATSIFNDAIRLTIVEAAWTLAQLVSSRPYRHRFYWLLTAPMWATYLASYALLGRALGVPVSAVALGLLARPFCATLGAGPLDRYLLLFAGGGALAILAAGLMTDGSGIRRACRLALRVGLPEGDVRSAFARGEDYDSILRAHFNDARSAAAGFGAHGLDGAVVQRLLPGGSDALTAVVETDGRFIIRKFAVGEAAAKLAEQADWLREHRAALPLADVIAERRGAAQHRFDMPYFGAAHDLYEMVHVMPAATSRELLRDVVECVDGWHSAHRRGECPDVALDTFIERKVIANAEVVLAHARTQLPERYRINDEIHLLSDWNRLLDRNWIRAQLTDRRIGVVHGDLTIENIIVCPERRPGWYLIDPNPTNLFDTPLIDWAKLMQSLHLGYEALNRGAPAQLEDGSIRVMFARSCVYAELHDELTNLLDRKLGKEGRREVAFHELVNYLRLIPYKLRNQPAKAMTFFACASVLLRQYEARYGTVQVD